MKLRTSLGNRLKMKYTSKEVSSKDNQERATYLLPLISILFRNKTTPIKLIRINRTYIRDNNLPCKRSIMYTDQLELSISKESLSMKTKRTQV
jgi:hypothetical protein